MSGEDQDNRSNMGRIFANIILVCLSVSIIATTIKFIMWLF